MALNVNCVANSIRNQEVEKRRFFEPLSHPGELGNLVGFNSGRVHDAIFQRDI